MWEPKTPPPAPASIRAYEHRTLGQVLRMVKDIRHLVRVKTRVRSARKARLTSQCSHSYHQVGGSLGVGNMNLLILGVLSPPHPGPGGGGLSSIA